MTTLQSYLIGGFLNFAGPITLLALFFWLGSLWRVLGPSLGLEAVGRGTLAWSAAGAAAVFLSTHLGFKVLSDETNLLSVANMLSVFGKASNTEMWQYYFHNYHALDVAVPTRPILFPLLVSLVQMMVGLRWWAPFVVNFLSLFLLFALVLHWASRALPARLLPAPTALLTLLMSPVLSIVATSAGYDLVSLAVGYGCFLLLLEYDRRRDAATLECLLFGLVCFASVRYESIIALPLTAAGLYLLEGKAMLRKLPPKSLLLAAVMILPLLVQRRLTWGSFENPPGVAPFSPAHAWKYLPVFLRSFFIDANGPYPIILHWLGLGGLALSLRRLQGVGMIPFVFLGFALTLLLSHHFGRADHPTQARLFLPVSFALGLLALSFLRDIEAHVDSRYLLMIFGVLLFHHRHYALHDPLTAQLTMTREVRHIRDFIAAEGRLGDLWIYDRPGQLSALGLSTLSWTKFKEKPKDTLENVRAGLFNRLLLIERVPYKPTSPEEFSLSRDGFRLLPLREHELSPEEKLRISAAELPPAGPTPAQEEKKAEAKKREGEASRPRPARR